MQKNVDPFLKVRDKHIELEEEETRMNTRIKIED